ncbi:TPA: tRNA (adenosine(37)-N6)-threonylcarbamoyltransferase complex ATPase subunit type 1 TsaE [Candidatus Falkowbacteria bacterium]|nr:tRNA (adenosine(37)-N6)-threonylcarbamoyltransferase complex ATPase subunit type 1 TsaE [Candidatus Falkowbacteria bacterium]
MRIITNSEQETFDFGRNLASELKGGEVFLLQGNLGAGKSVLVRGVASGLGITKQITSPTFVIMKVYDVFNHATIKKLVHIDAYRVEAVDLFQIGLEEYLNHPETVVFIEWGEKVEPELKKHRVKTIRISHQDNSREINIQ